MKTTWVHDLNNVRKQGFSSLALGLDWVREEKITGYVVTPNSQVLSVRNGKILTSDEVKLVGEK